MSSSPLGTHHVVQIGIIVRDLEESTKAWSQLLGVPAPQIMITDPVEISRAKYGGQLTSALAKLAFIPLGQVTLELIEPIGEPSTWNDQLVQHGQSLHHVAFEIKGMADKLAVLKDHGLSLIQHGEYPGGRYSYLDGQEKYGAILELLEND